MSFFPKNHDTALWILGSLIVLTLSSVPLSYLVDTNFSFRSEPSSLEKSITSDRQTIAVIRRNISKAERRLTTSVFRAQNTIENLEARKLDIASIKAETKKLANRRDELVEIIADVTTAFINYADDYRSEVRKDAVGEKMQHLILRNGRQYDKVVIAKVTETGLQIDHSYGRAHVDARHLSDALHDRFQWAQMGEPTPSQTARTGPILHEDRIPE